ncbi:SRPBCC domain-containing protein [Acrocarpospora macrocephala]|uniref:Activator of Hsp90 ATPase homologue 1/2-like C-terminal domain-containing protein n=1 Tax=Acrocarpospora macrocephala TaxID=150177 RepID=A0A5M3WQT4_9ACTN|nr:SRPBCC domain-containing protein [Acrocarpospora macrocephala]GES10489.1 hypothetical protein Amac_040860 [Acrocarpospora macrocephala]
MPREFEVREEIALDATPEQVWAAIATGPGVDSWFMGRNEIEPREGGAGRQTVLGVTGESTVTAWEPGVRFATRTHASPEGTFMAFEYLLESRDGGSTLLRLVHSGFLEEDWESEYEALRVGDGMYLRKLAAYLRCFPGRTSVYDLFLAGSSVTTREDAWARFAAAFGLAGWPVTPGRPMVLSVPGLPAETGTVLFASYGFLGAVTASSLYTLVHGHHGLMVAQQHCFTGEPARERAQAAWQAWLG